MYCYICQFAYLFTWDILTTHREGKNKSEIRNQNESGIITTFKPPKQNRKGGFAYSTYMSFII